MSGIMILTIVAAMALVCQGVLPRQTPTIYCGDYPYVFYIHLTNSSYIVRSPNYGISNYSTNQQCSVEFRSINSTLQFTIRFNSFGLEYQERCTYDSLCVKGVKFCGNWESGYSFIYVVPYHQTFTLTFRSDGSNVGPGFEINVDILAIGSDKAVNEPSSGVGSSFDRLVFQPSYPKENYADPCSTYRDPNIVH